MMPVRGDDHCHRFPLGAVDNFRAWRVAAPARTAAIRRQSLELDAQRILDLVEFDAVVICDAARVGEHIGDPTIGLWVAGAFIFSDEDLIDERLTVVPGVARGLGP
jgi:hypothetical protein